MVAKRPENTRHCRCQFCGGCSRKGYQSGEDPSQTYCDYVMSHNDNIFCQDCVRGACGALALKMWDENLKKAAKNA